MAKDVDINGFWSIKGNPVTKEGVFPYTGKQIDFNGSLGLEPNKLYNVYRPAAELSKEETLESFNGVPLIDDHEMVGEGCTPYDDRAAAGVLMNPRLSETNAGMIVGDFKIFSEKLKNLIQQGKKALSLGYRCTYDAVKGIWQGQTYDFIQRNMFGNHVALVNEGRMGSSVRVYDHKATVFDSMPIEVTEPITEGKSAMTEEEKKAAEQQAAEESARLVRIAAEEAEAKVRTAAAEAAAKAAQEEADRQKALDEAAEAEKKAKEEAEKSAAMDSAVKSAVIQLAERDALVKQVQPLVGAFDTAAMLSADDVAVYACSKLKLDAGKGEAKAMIKGFLAGKAGSGMSFAQDAAPKSGKDAALEKYLKGE